MESWIRWPLLFQTCGSSVADGIALTAEMPDVKHCIADACSTLSSSPANKKMRLQTLNGRPKRKLLLNLLNISPRHIGIVGKHGQPLFRDGAPVIALAIVQHFHGKQVISHRPGWFQVPCGRNQV